MRYPSSKDIDNMVQVLSEMKRRGVDSETVSRLQSVVTGFANAGIHGGPKLWSPLYLYRAMPCIARTMFSQDVCLSSPVRQSVCLSHAGMLSKRFNIMITLFSPSDRHIVLVFAAPNTMANILTQTLLTGGPMQGGMKKSRFLTNISLYLRNDTKYAHS